MMQKSRAFAQKLVVPTAGLFALSVLLQAFFAGSAALIDPQYWALHLTWVGIFQWLSVVLAAAAWAGGRGASQPRPRLAGGTARNHCR
jgi:hypothetical protein